MNPRTLTYWKWMLRQESQGPRIRRDRPLASKAPAAASFVEVHSTPAAAAFELALRDGRRLQIPSAFDADTLTRLLAVLERS